jgi:nitroreductase
LGGQTQESEVPDAPIASSATERLASARYGAAAAPQLVELNEVLRTLLSHRSVRRYRPDPLPPHTLETLVATGQSASTSSNLQAWSVVAVEDAGRKARLAAVAGGQAHITQCPLFLVFLADLSRLDRLGAAQGKRLEGLDYLETFMVAIIDAALAAQNVVVALQSLGLASVYIGALRNDPETVARELGLPPHAMAVFGLCVGYADRADTAEIKPRLAQATVLHRERYDAGQDAAAIAAYDDVLGAFSEAQGMAESEWTSRMLSRVGTASALRGREHMTSILQRLGFALR